MGSIVKIATACGFALAFLFLISIGHSVPANAQGGVVCDFGSKRYKDCCRRSYREHPKLGFRKRADDIDACMDEKAAVKKDKGKDTKDTKEAARKDKSKASSKSDSKKNNADDDDDDDDEPTKPVEEKKK